MHSKVEIDLITNNFSFFIIKYILADINSLSLGTIIVSIVLSTIKSFILYIFVKPFGVY